MTLSKINEPVTITPYKSSEISFELSRAYSTPSLNVISANVFQLNQICDAFNNLRHIHFPYIADGKIGALLGVNAFAFTYPTHVIQGNQHQPFGVKTKLCWTLADEYENCCTNNHPKSSNLPNKAFVFQVSRDRMDEPELDELVQQFWRIESEGIQPDSKPSSPLDQKFFQIMKDSINFNGQRFEIKLPWKENSNSENNYFSALSQVKSLNRRLERNPQLRDNYMKTLQTDLEKNYIKPVEMQDPLPDRIWYLPHHPVENPNKPGKVRRVANAASKFRGKSLNSNLLTGPELLNSLLGVLMRFRENQIAVLADIEGMFMQIAVNQTD